MPDALRSHVFEQLDRLTGTGRCIALAYSGGGDSHALQCFLADWCRSRDRDAIAFTVDHGLRSESAGEAALAAERAERLGLTARVLRWQGDPAGTGIQARARNARHSLLAQACRDEGIDTLLTAHTLDDQAETVWMRLAAGGGWRACAGMEPLAPSPVWPEGRGIRIARPLLAVRREALRAELADRDERWIEDPSNEDDRFERVRVRRQLTELEGAGLELERFAALASDIQALISAERRAAARLAERAVRFEAWGGIRLDLRRYRSARPVIRRRLLDAACLAVSGAAHPPGQAALDRLDAALIEARPATAAGVGLLAWRDAWWLVRDRGAVLGRADGTSGAGILRGDGEEAVWDGRFEVEFAGAGLEAGALGDSYAGLADRTVLDVVPGAARSGLLAIRERTGNETVLSTNNRVVALAGLVSPPEGVAGVKPLAVQRFWDRLGGDADTAGLRSGESLVPTA